MDALPCPRSNGSKATPSAPLAAIDRYSSYLSLNWSHVCTVPIVNSTKSKPSRGRRDHFRVSQVTSD
jgi:hypothetical protein